MTVSPHLQLPYILPSQAQKHITHNEAIAALDTLAQLAVLDRHLAGPPASPAEGDRYIVAPSPTGAWAGRANEVAAWDGAAWRFHAPRPGWLAFLVDENGLVAWSGAAWAETAGLDGKLPMLGIGATPDATNRLAVAADAVLFTNASDDVQLKLNKHSSGDTASMLFQSNWSGRAEFGLTGDDKFHIKLSPDGSAWSELLVADPATGRLGIGSSTPAARLDVDGTVKLKSYTLSTLPPATSPGQLAYVSDESGGAVTAFSDGTDWRRMTDRAVVG